ncbi:MAG: DUF262 domain-containing protein, partial [Clostridia bacterium]|nr:DUF262 domain-containing protein [Clostridia bacterium]
MIVLETKNISQISGEFIVPAYQRGYRWKEEVTRLLEDLMEIDQSKSYRYCLQPIVIKKLQDSCFELIDGQQRLTTIFLIYKVIKQFLPHVNVKFSLNYITRESSKEYLNEIPSDKAFEQKEENIDFYFMWQAYKLISEWFENQDDPSNVAINIYRLLCERVDVIWYEVDKEVDGNLLFQRLNIGKIPLTSSELVKAIFLSEHNVNNRKEEIAYQWDNIEKELHDKSFWGFLTNNKNYQTRIDLILNLIAKHNDSDMEKYATFFYFDKLRKETDLMTIWQNIQHTFLILKDWFKNHTLYHKIGYLISVGYQIQQIFDLSLGKTKSEFIYLLDSMIKDSVKIRDNYGDLSYNNTADYKNIYKLLLLFNVESTRCNGEESEWFAFDQFKKNKWSLEHIHAQNSDGMHKQEQFKEWVKLHVESVKTVGKIKVENQSLSQSDLDQLLADIEKFKDEKLDLQSKFEEIELRVVKILSEDSSVAYLHSISNLALLNTQDNAALNNATFDVKRNKIIELDKEGKFIPFCTKMV